MENRSRSVDSWPTSPDSDDHEQNFHSMQPEAPQAAPFASSNSQTPQATAGNPAANSSDSYEKMQLPSPPGRRQRMAQIGRPWTTTVYDCGLDRTNAIMTALCPCVTFGHIAEIVDEGQTSCTAGSFMYLLLVPALCSCWIVASIYRKKLRKKYSLVQAPAGDWILHFFCPLCSLCQEFRELKSRGIDPALGWMGYLAKQREETLTIPPKSQVMSI
ncbi:protein PLANT CADMIUM RESISTANCE 8-like [Phalaenopsis equestris]|uniref:protein PLANT CADMIUM RESISTANCE 8-like n=1 Tax=Phalaenopsis equestris TaxID=78828 RepID=UPI0009E457A7|nr:protein PLANT CADMIUM RESISTANCE 8-like [Phalaenopsis equestris]